MIELLQRTLNAELPITLHLGVRVVQLEPGLVVLAAPLTGNRNHKGTAFAGSLNAVATLAAWSWFWAFLELRREAAQVVVQDSTIRYTRPVTSDFTASCVAPTPSSISQFLASYNRSGRGRLGLHVEVADQAGVAATFNGRFVAERVGSGSADATTPAE
ncbi:MAG: YiiD C-terminal domain-containing protein [Gemmatimonadota bacterium]